MKLTNLSLLEGKAKICPKCGKQMTGFHYYYKGEWRCKKGSAEDANNTSTPSNAPQQVSTQVAAAPEETPKAVEPKKSKEVTPKQTISAWLDKQGITNYSFNEDGSIDVNGDVRFFDLRYYQIPVKFRNVSGSFEIIASVVQSLKNSPEYVGGDFIVSGNDISSLEGAPKKIEGDFDCSGNPLTNFNCSYGIQVGDTFIYDADASETSPETLESFHKTITHARRVDIGCNIKSHLLSVMMVRGLKELEITNNKLSQELHRAADIINKHLGTEDRDILLCQEELIDAGLAAHAKVK